MRDHGHVQFARALAYDFKDLCGLACQDARNAFLQNAGFFQCDANEVGAKESLVVMRDWRDYGQGRPVDHVGRIEPAAKPCFQQDDVSRVFGEGEEGCGGRDLEKGDGFAFVCGLDAQQHVAKNVL